MRRSAKRAATTLALCIGGTALLIAPPLIPFLAERGGVAGAISTSGFVLICAGVLKHRLRQWR